MALPASGQISMSQVNTELGRSSTAQISLGESAVRSLAGVASGQISMNNLLGKSAGGTFSPDGGTSSSSPVNIDETGYGGTISATIFCTASATFTVTRTGSTLGSTPASGTFTGTSLTFSLTNNSTSIRSTQWTVSATSGSTTRYWVITLTNEGLV